MVTHSDRPTLVVGERLQFRGNPLAEIVLRFPCPQRILMVTDGSLNFGTGFFGLSEFVGIVTAAGHSVATAHRSGAGPTTIPGSFDFASAATPVTLANYDQIWLFGFSTTPLTAVQQAVIAKFMQAGGGVFATGDHETLGMGMGNNVPRVRSMRNWATVPMTNPSRLDTVLDPGIDGIKQFDDQADAIPQRIFPVFFSNGGPDNAPSSWAVHPVLRHSSGAVDFLPDHPHESECLAPVPVAGNFAGVVEWPAPTAGGARIAPQVVAVSVSAGRFLTDTRKPPVRPRCFGAISAYDGDAAGVGRVICDATWHHFVNINLNGAGATPDTTGTARTGLYANQLPTPEYLKIQRYYLNTVRWLAPLRRRVCWPFLEAALLRFDPELMELPLPLPLPRPWPWDPLLRIGSVAEEAATRHWGPGATAEIVDEMLTATKAAPALAKVMRSLLPPSGRAEVPHHLLPLQDMRRVALGAVVNLLATHLPDDEERLAEVLRDGHDDLASKVLVEAIDGAQASLANHLAEALRNTAQAAAALTRKREVSSRAGKRRPR